MAKLQKALHINVESAVDQRRLLDSGPDDLGVDSLIAVDIRAWFLKELEIDMPVLKILGGSKLTDLLSFAVEKLPEHLKPNFSTGGEATKVYKADLPIISSVPQVTEQSEKRSSSQSESSDTASAGSKDIVFEDWEQSIALSSPESTESCSVENSQIMQKVSPMSPGQSRFWFLNHLLEDKTTSNIAFSIELSGYIRKRDLEDAVMAMGARHEALRTRFFMDENQKPMQGILPESLLHLMKKSITHDSQVANEFEAMKNHVFDIGRGEIMKLLLLSLDRDRNFLVIGYHHINMDGISLEIFLSDLQKAYNHKELPGNVLQYPEYSSKQRQEIESGKMKQEVQYWKTDLANPPPTLPTLPFSSTRSRSPLEKYDHNREDYRIENALQVQIRRMCQNQKTGPFHFYLAVFEVLLFKLLGADDLCIGMADAGRIDEATSKSMGIYLNLLPLRFRLKSNQSFADVLKETRKKAHSAIANSRVPFDVLLEELRVARSTSYSPLFQVFINYRQGISEKRSFGSFQGEGGEYAFGRTPYDTILDIMDNPGSSTLLMFMVQKQLYSNSDAKRLIKMYLNLVKHFTHAPTSRVGQASLFAKEEIDGAIKLGQGTSSRLQIAET